MSKPVGLRTEIITTLSLLMGAALLLGGVLMLRLTEQSLLEQKVTQLRLMTGVVAQALKESVLPADMPGGKGASPFALNILNTLPDELNHQGWWLYGSDLQLIAAYHLDSSLPFAAARHQQLRVSGEALEVVEFPSLLQMFSATVAHAHFAQPLYVENRFLGILDIRYSLEDIRYRLMFSQRMVLLYVLLYGSVLVCIGYYLLQRNIIKPAHNLLHATEDVSRGHLETRLPIAGPVEIADLAKAYNQMVDALQRSRAETQSHITALQLTNNDLQQAREELIRSEKLASVGQLAAGLAHELGNPLAALIGYLEILKVKLTEGNREIVQRSLKEAERIDYLIRELLGFSRSSDGAFDLVNIVEPLHEAIQFLQHQATFSAVEIVVRLPDSLPAIRANRQKLQQLYVNLLMNAAQACIRGGTIVLSAGCDSNLWLKFEDNGCGIGPEILASIFDPFFTTKEPGEGTGLGLSICHRIVDELNGKISVESWPSIGSCFLVEFPTNSKY